MPHQRALGRLRELIPTGSTLPAAEFERRHRLLLGLLWLHAPAVFILALATGVPTGHAFVEAGVVLAPAALATWGRIDGRQASALVALGLITCSAIIVHLSDGVIEAHFHFFVMIVALALYEDWLPFGLGAGYVLVHHAVGGLVAPESVFNHAAAIANPVRWAAIHAAFVSAAGALGVVTWRMNEDTRQAQRTALDRAVAAEEQARHSADELARSNRDLAQFASVASHDLSEPLRTISSFVQLLERRYRDELDDDAKEWIGYAVDGSQRMQRLIDDLLDYSRAGSREIADVPVALTALVDEVTDSLGTLLTDAGATVEYGVLPAVRGDEGQLGLVLQNLVANAVKFIADDKPVVRISAESDDDGRIRVSVCDNGIGIAPEQAARVFDMFQRLHARSEYEGTGIGLAVCQRIVERHGGRIWVEPAEGGGSCFSFTLAPA